MNLLEQIKENAKKCNKRIVLPEGTEERTLKAADILIGEGIAQIILIGNPAEIKALAEKFELKISVKPQSSIPKITRRKKRMQTFWLNFARVKV